MKEYIETIDKYFYLNVNDINYEMILAVIKVNYSGDLNFYL